METEQLEFLDLTDAEHIEQVLRSRGWRLIEERYRMVVESKLGELEQDLPQDRTAHVRGYLRGVRRCLQIPYEMVQEARAGL